MIKHLKTDCKRIESEILSLQSSLQAKQNSLAELENLTEKLNKAIPEDYKKLLLSCNLSVEVAYSTLWNQNETYKIVVTRQFNPPLKLFAYKELIYNLSIDVRINDRYLDFGDNLIYGILTDNIVNSEIIFPKEINESNWFVNERKRKQAKEQQERLFQKIESDKQIHINSLQATFDNLLVEFPNNIERVILEKNFQAGFIKIALKKGNEKIVFYYGIKGEGTNKKFVGYNEKGILFETQNDFYKFICQNISDCEILASETNRPRKIVSY
jgi:hypothetical protein